MIDHEDRTVVFRVEIGIRTQNENKLDGEGDNDGEREWTVK